MKKDLRYYMSLPYGVMFYPAEEGGFVVEIQDLPGCLSQGETYEEAVEMINDAKLCWLSYALEKGMTIPEPSQNQRYSGKLSLRISPKLHAKIADVAKNAGISINAQLVEIISEAIGQKQENKMSSQCVVKQSNHTYIRINGAYANTDNIWHMPVKEAA